MIGPDISLNVKLWALFIAIIEQTGASGTWVFTSSGAQHYGMAASKEKLRNNELSKFVSSAALRDGIKN